MLITYKPEGYLIETKKNAELISSLPGLEYAMQHDIILEGMAMLCDSRYELHVSLGEIEGIIRRDEVAANRDGSGIKDIAIAILSRQGSRTSRTSEPLRISAAAYRRFCRSTAFRYRGYPTPPTASCAA